MTNVAVTAPCPAPAELERMLHLLRELPGQARDAVRGLTDAQLDTPLRAGGWTVRQVVHHVAEAHSVAFFRMKLLLTEAHPTLKPWDQDLWCAMDDERQGPVEPSLRLLEGVHGRIVELVARVRPEHWGRTAFHPDYGVLTLRDFLATYSGHGAHHLGQVLALRRAQGW